MRRFALLAGLCVLGCNGSSQATTSNAGGAGQTGNGTGTGVTTGATGTQSTSATGQTGATTGATGSTGTGTSSVGSGTPSGVTVLVEPGAGIQPLLTAIQNAQTSVHMTMYLLTSTAVMDALIAQKQKGHEVKVVLNQQFPSGGNQNSSAFSTLSSGGVSVVYAPPGFTYTHEKCVIIDGKQAWIMTMNATVTSATSNREYLAIDDYQPDVTEADAIFQADYAHTSITPSGDLVVAPTNAEPSILALVNKAQQSILIEGEEFSDSYVTNAVAAKAMGGVSVHVVLSNLTPTTAGAQTIAMLKSHGAKIVTVASPYIHAKAVVVDGASAYVGSANLTYNSLSFNRELGIITNISQVVSTVGSTIATDFANGTPQ